MSTSEAWLESGALVIDGDTVKLRSVSTFSGNRWPDFAAGLSRVVSEGALEGAVHVELALATVGALWTAGEMVGILASSPSAELRTLSLGALMAPPDLARLEARWPAVQRAFPSLEHGALACWRWSAKPRLRVLAVGPHFASLRPQQLFALEANGSGPWLRLRNPPAGASEFDALALQVYVSSDNVTTMTVSPLEFTDEVRVNGRLVEVQKLSMHRDGQVLHKGTIQWFPVPGDVIEVLGLVVRYEADVGHGPFSSRQSQVMFMGNQSSHVTLTLGEGSPVEEDDDD